MFLALCYMLLVAQQFVYQTTEFIYKLCIVVCFIRLWKNLHFDGSSSRALRGLFRLTYYDSSFALNEIIKEKTISIFFLSISFIVRCVRVFSSRLEHHLLSKERTRSIILKYIELRIIALFSCRESERE